MKNRRINKIKDQKGASAIEFAIILPILVIILFGIFQFGIAFNNYITVTHAAREGARLAAVAWDDDEVDIEAIIIERSFPIVPDSIEIIPSRGSTPKPKIGDPVEVIVIYTVNVDIPLVNSWDIPLSSKAIMRLENYSF